ncbi:hypothetical protein [Duganella sp. FT27W]|uniref:hypothetical protein n=1 Tax=Duganella sp. FT27W TaxID=2654636 RepID=UPI00128DFAE8|nr:hypothetical protein [Duganella sp. FT27W]MPQ56354.1 hypothetical protein [Duganella sp. FT27W]
MIRENFGATMTGRPLRGTEITQILVDEYFDSEITKGSEQMAKAAQSVSEETIRRTKELAEAMSAYFSMDEKVKTDLLSPATLTAKVPGKGYRKVSHVGGETFIFDGVYVGATNRLIFVLVPESGSEASGYTQVELTEQEGQNLLDNFRSHCTAAAGRNFREAMHEIHAVERQAAKVEEVAEKATDYEQYGSW